MRFSLGGGLLTLLLIAGCGGGGSESSDGRADGPIMPTTRDSAGVTIADFPADVLERAPLIGFDTVPLYRAGSGIDSIDLSQARDVALLSDGRIVAAARRDNHLLLFANDGGLQRVLGRTGEGPGEFQQIDRMFVVPGDSIVAVDYTGRASIFSPDSGYVRTFRLPAVREFPTVHALTGRAGRDWFLAPAWSASNGPPEFAARNDLPISIARVSESAGVAGTWDTIGTMLPTQQVVHTLRIGGQDRELATEANFVARPMAVAHGSDGLVTAQGDRWEVRIYDHSGLRQVIRADRPRVPVTPALIETHITSRLARMRESRPDLPDSLWADAEATLRSQPNADSLPAMVRLHATAGDLIWVVDHPMPGVDTVWATALSPSRGVVGRLALPTRSYPVAFAEDRVVVPQPDDDGVVTFAMHRLRVPE